MGLFSKLGGRSAPQATTSINQPQKKKSSYNGIQINVNSEECCQAARKLEGQRFLANEVPMLPLDGCDAAECRCAYERFDDRRTDARRLSDVGYDMASQLHDQENRINTSGRRDDDQDL